MSVQGITTHVLDTSRGKAAAGIGVQLEQRDGSGTGWLLVGTAETNTDGRVSNLLPSGVDVGPAEYRLTFDTRAYFAALSTLSLYPRIVIHFETVAGQAHYHVPLLLSPFGYSTYRGT